MDLRERIVAARNAGESVERVANRFGVCTKMVRTYEKQAVAGLLSPTPRPGKSRRLDEAEHSALRALLHEHPDWTLASLSQVWHERGGEELPSSTLHDALVRLEMTHKKRVAGPASDAPGSEQPSDKLSSK